MTPIRRARPSPCRPGPFHPPAGRRRRRIPGANREQGARVQFPVQQGKTGNWEGGAPEGGAPGKYRGLSPISVQRYPPSHRPIAGLHLQGPVGDAGNSYNYGAAFNCLAISCAAWMPER